MGKRKKDFEKVRIKVGRKLKRQNETLVNIRKRKIILHKDRANVQDRTVEKTTEQMFDTAINSLSIDKSSVQSCAMRTLIRILETFTKRLIVISSHCDSTFGLPYRSFEKLIDIHQNLFGYSTGSLCIQLGNLLHTVSRFCRSVEDLNFSSDIEQLLLHLMKITAFSPKLPDLLDSYNNVVISLLQRVDNIWKDLGCRLSGYCFELHSKYISTMSVQLSVSPCSSVVIVDPIKRILYSQTYCHLLTQYFQRIRQMSSVKCVSSQRSELIRTTCQYLKSCQYAIYMTSNQIHPWIQPIPFSSSLKRQSAQVYFPINGYYVNYLFSCPSHGLPVTTESALSGLVKQNLLPMSESNNLENSKSNYTIEDGFKRPTQPSAVPFFVKEVHNEQRLVSSLITEGIILLEELVDHPTERHFQSLYHMIRALRAAIEVGGAIFFTNSLHTSDSQGYKTIGWYENQAITPSDLHSSLERFIQKLYSIYPVELPDFEAVKFHANNTRVDLANMSNRQLRERMKRKIKATKRLNKVSAAGATQGNAKISHSHKPPMQTTRKLTQLIQSINQAALELFTYLEYMFSSVNVSKCMLSRSVSLIWPPPVDTQQRMVALWFNLVLENASHSLINLTGWLRAFDTYLIAPHRFKWKVCNELWHKRLFVAPILLTLGQLFQLISKQQLDDSAVTSLSGSQYRLIGRCAGLLTYCLTMELMYIKQKIVETNDIPKMGADQQKPSPSVDFITTPELYYNETWIVEHLNKIQIPSAMLKSMTVCGNIFPNLANYLSKLTCLDWSTMQTRVRFVTPLSKELITKYRDYFTGTIVRGGDQFLDNLFTPVQIIDNTLAACLLQLTKMQYAASLKCVKDNELINEILSKTEVYSNNIYPLNFLCEKLNLTAPSAEDPSDYTQQFGWLVHGYLPTQNGCYSCPKFWRAAKEQRSYY